MIVIKFFFISYNLLNHKERKAELEAIQSNAIRLAMLLWTQREYFDSLSQERLPVFRSPSDCMTTHGVQNKLANSLNGSPVLLCVQPAIIAYGDENAENYDVTEVWAKAIMLVDATGAEEPEDANKSGADGIKFETED